MSQPLPSLLIVISTRPHPTKKPEALTSGFFIEHPHADSNRGSMTENHMS